MTRQIMIGIFIFVSGMAMACGTGGTSYEGCGEKVLVPIEGLRPGISKIYCEPRMQGILGEDLLTSYTLKLQCRLLSVDPNAEDAAE